MSGNLGHPHRVDGGMTRGKAAWRTAAQKLCRRQRRLAIAGLVLAIVGALLVGGPWVWVRGASDGRVLTAEQAGTAPVALVLGAGLTETDEPTPFLAARLDVAAALYRAGKVKVLLVSGDNRTADHNEPDAMRRYLVQRRAIPYERIVTDYAGRDTYDSCVRANRIFGVDHVLVVSQAYHLPRAVAICRAVGLTAEGVGDWTAQQFRQEWASGSRREVLADIKAAGDVLTRRDPVLGRTESGVADALRLADSAETSGAETTGPGQPGGTP